MAIYKKIPLLDVYYVENILKKWMKGESNIEKITNELNSQIMLLDTDRVLMTEIKILKQKLELSKNSINKVRMTKAKNDVKNANKRANRYKSKLEEVIAKNVVLTNKLKNRQYLKY